MKGALVVGLVAVVVAGCASVTPTPAIVHATPAPSPPAAGMPTAPTPTATTAPASDPTPTAAPTGARLEIVPCDVDKDDGCQNRAYRVTSPTSLGSTVKLTWTVRNVGTKTSGPISAVMFGCSPLGGCSHTRYWLPDRFTLVGCSPKCKGAVVNDQTGWELEWAGKIAPGKKQTLIVTFKARYAAYNYLVVGLYAASRKQLDDNLGDWGPFRLGDWGEMQVVVN